MSSTGEYNSQVTVFLGAGASVPLGVPDTKKIVETLEMDLKCYAKRIHEIRECVKSFGFLDDIEAVLSVVDFWANPKDAILEMGPSFAETTKYELKTYKKRTKETRMSRRIKDYIVRKCFVRDEPIIIKTAEIYGQFFQGLSQTFPMQNCDPPGRLICPAIDVFTTNYDNLIELYAKKNGIRIYDGYREQTTGYYAFDQDYYSKSSTSLRLYKLHGTVTCAKLKSGEIERLPFIPKRGPLVISGQKAFPDLIYPGMHRYLAKEPQLELLNLFKSSLITSKTCIVIGYSFRDPNIEQVFTDSCRRNSSLKFFLVSPNANQIIEERKLKKSQFYPVNKRFENLDVRNDIGGVS